jgi:uncharacterized protein YjiS (DUF1127 family)
MALSSATVPHIGASTRQPTWTERWALWIRRHRTRRALRDLDARQLGDVAITVSERSAECAKWFWQA